jgi:hypothetical protein
MTDTVITNATDLLLPETPAAITELQFELEEAITGLWSAHVNAKRTARATNEELRVIRATLGAQLSDMKQMLVKPGCEGQWSGFLRQHAIPRATADRLVERHHRSLNPEPNCVTEPNAEPTAEDVHRLFISVWPKLRRVLTTRQGVHLFVDLLTSHCHSEITE